MLNQLLKYTCPYCKVEGREPVTIQNTRDGKQLVTCEEDGGGCGQVFVMGWTIEIEVTIAAISEFE